MPLTVSVNAAPPAFIVEGLRPEIVGVGMLTGNVVAVDAVPPAFVTVIVGGMGSLFGAIVGGLLIGLTISLTTLYIPAASEVAMYVLMAGILLVRPRGLFGEEGIFG